MLTSDFYVGPKCAAKFKGIIPRIAKDTFGRANEILTSDENVTFKITASMLEIYVGSIYDLLIAPEAYSIKTRPALDMQMDSVSGLSQLPVATEDDVTDLLVRGFGNQTKAPTGLNVDSSRGHTIFTLDVNKIVKNPKAKKKSEKEQVVHCHEASRSRRLIAHRKSIVDHKGAARGLVDSEVWESQQSDGQDDGVLQGGAHDRGQVHQQLADHTWELRQAGGHRIGIEDLKLRKIKMDQIAWRTSSLTRLLRTALNGNCKTIMIAAVSPSLTEYPETLSTMRYANQIKAIKSTANKKEAKLMTGEQLAAIKIKELEDALKAALEGGGGGGGGPEVMRELQEQMDEMKKKEAEYYKKEESFNAQMCMLKEEQKKRDAIRESGPHLLEILNNPMTSGLVPTGLPEGSSVLCGSASSAGNQLLLRGTGVKNNHCTFTITEGNVTRVPGEENSQCMLNGNIIDGTVTLERNDRIRLAENNYFRFIDPTIAKLNSDDDNQEDDAKYEYTFCARRRSQHS
jgi:hypothetical protein